MKVASKVDWDCIATDFSSNIKLEKEIFRIGGYFL